MFYLGIVNGTLADDGERFVGTFQYYEKTIPITFKRIHKQLSQPELHLTQQTRSPRWTFKTEGPIWSSPALHADQVFFGSKDGKVYALKTETGQLSWAFPTNGPVMGSPSVVGGAIYVLSDDGYLYKLGADSGEEVWRFDTHGGAFKRDAASYDYGASAVTVSGGTAFVGSADHHLYAIDAASGEEQWRFRTAGVIRSKPAVADGLVVFGSFDHHVYAVEVDTGEPRWKYDSHGPIPSSPTIYRNTVIIGSRNSDLHALDLSTGVVKWKHFYWTSWVESSARIFDSTLYIGASDFGALLALDAASGNEVWVSILGGSVWSTPAVTEDRVYVGVVGTVGYGISHKGSFAVVDRRSGAVEWRYPFDEIEGSFTYGVASSPCVSEHLIFFGGLDVRSMPFHHNPTNRLRMKLNAAVVDYSSDRPLKPGSTASISYSTNIMSLPRLTTRA